ncbi:TPA: hypothetical protein ACNHQ5_004380 [Escherichia coli]|jgi:hypothetical protein|nr:hypothetical protein [Bradyrhizobium sp.]
MRFDSDDVLALAALAAFVGAFVFYVVPRIDLAIAVFDHLGALQ